MGVYYKEFDYEALKRKRDYLKAKSDLRIYKMDIKLRLKELLNEYERAKKEIHESRKKDSVFVKGQGGYLDEIDRQNDLNRQLKKVKKQTEKGKEECEQILSELEIKGRENI